MELSERQRMILKAIIDDYVATAIPVGSRTLSRKYMSDLEELGYLLQPHTSAGRIPSDKAYRLYVNSMLERDTIAPDEARQIRAFIRQRMDELEEVIRRTAHIISDLTQYTALVMAPQLRRTTLRRIQLVPVTSNTALVAIITDASVVKDNIIRIPEGISEDDLAHISRMLTERFAGHSIADIDVFLMDGLREQIHEYRELFEGLMNALGNSLVQPDRNDLIMDGTVNIFRHPEYKDWEKAKAFLTLLETRERLYRMLSTRTKWEFTITIGDENQESDLQDCSVVTATYHVGSRPMGSIGVIGPTRMDYNRVVSVLGHIGRSLGEVISNQLERDRQEKEHEQGKQDET